MQILSIDIGGTAVKHAVIDEAGTILAQGSFPTPQNFPELQAGLADAARKYSIRYELSGAALSLPGTVDEEAGVIHQINAIPYLQGEYLPQKIGNFLGLPLSMENDANCAALGEMWLGAARGAGDIVFVICGTGVGGALLHKGEILHGRHFLGGELGFMRLNDQGGTLDDLGSVGGLVRRVEQAKALPSGSLDGQQVFTLAEQGDTCASAEIGAMYRALALGIVNAQYIFDPELFLIGGAISSRPGFIKQLQAHVATQIALVPVVAVEPRIVACQFGNTANLLGAVRHFLDRQTANIE